MDTKRFKRLMKRKDAQTIKEEFMMGKHGNLTEHQLEKICRSSRGGGSISFGRKMTAQQMEDRKKELEEKAKRDAMPIKKRKHFLERINFKYRGLKKEGKIKNGITKME